MEIFKLERHLTDFGMSPKSFAERYAFRITTSGKLNLVETAPKKITFYDKEFLGSFVFYEGTLKRVVLRPIMKDVIVPDYPSKEYQELKFLYCESFLRKTFGNRPVQMEDGVQWTTDGYVIGCYTSHEGKDKYTGGNIIIEARRDAHPAETSQG